MAKIKAFSGIKKDASGEIYRFRNGLAVVPGFLIGHKEVKITLAEFAALNKEEEQDEA